MLQDLESLVRCESPSEDLSACKKVVQLANEIATRELGTAAEILEVNGRPVFWWGDKNPKVVLLCHLDTVWPIGSFNPIWQIDGDVLRGPGTFDMKVGFIQALYALKDIQGSVALIATTDEEIGSHSSKELIMQVSKTADAVLVLEASLDGKVKTGRKGTAMYVVKAVGLASHAGLEPEKGINATVEIAAQILKLKELENSEFGTTVVPTMLKGGTTANTVPAEATLEIDARSFSQSDLERVDRAIQSLTAITPGAQIEITGGLNRPVLEPASCKELYEIAEKVAKSIGMAPLGSAQVGGASDGNFAAAAGARVLDGLGAIGGGAHAVNEWASIKAIEERKNFLNAFIKELLK
ncbi:MAG: M20 family peptidase [Actinobacteria bacterium]|nr:M20 family peptidase [Actinomycetota bacterium]